MFVVPLQKNILSLHLKTLQLPRSLFHLVYVGNQLPLLTSGRDIDKGVLDMPDKVLHFGVIDEKGSLNGLNGLRSLQNSHPHQFLGLRGLEVLLGGRQRHPFILLIYSNARTTITIRYCYIIFLVQIPRKMGDNEISEIFAYLSKEGEVSSEKVKQIFSTVFREAKPLPSMPPSFSKQEFQQAFTRASQPERIDEELLYLFYHLDKDKKGFLVPEDIMTMFEAVGRKITLNEIENSFKYAKVYKNKMSFEDFKEYYNNF